jgi:hypothetical protein
VKNIFNDDNLSIYFYQSSVCSYKSIGVSCFADAHYRTFDGACNNLINPWWGSANVPFRRLLKANYADGKFDSSQ